MRDVFTPTAEAGWTLVNERYDARDEGSLEARFAIGNGFLGMRAARSVSRASVWLSFLRGQTWTAWPRTYVAGLFDAPETDPPVPALVPLADWSRVRITLDGEPLLLRTDEILQHRRTLDMRCGVLLADWRQRVPGGAVAHVQTLRLLSQADRAIGLQVMSLEIDGPPARVTLEASFEAAGLGMQTQLLEQELGVWRTSVSDRSVAMAGAVALSAAGDNVVPATPVPLTWRWNWISKPGEAIGLTRFVAVARGDTSDDDPAGAARGALARATSIGWRGALADHKAAWAELWAASDIVVEGDAAAAKALRFAVYHLNSTANPADERVSVGARALTGDGYLGHVFWDTEIYLVPFYTLTWPAAARAMLLYRFHTLPSARDKAAAAGWRGAMYAWESADTGHETTPDRVMTADGKLVDVLSGKLEQHISSDVAYAVWHYWRATGDDEFMLMAGAEILLETARFWASRAGLEADGYSHIRDVIGPDEYHENIDDNAFTNVMARWNIRRGVEIAAWLQTHAPERWAELTASLRLRQADLTDWAAIAETLVTGFNDATGLFEQFEGYFGLEDIDLAPYADRTVPMDVVLGRERTQRSQVVKQADVVALIALHAERYSHAVRKVNFDYYAPRCGHGSSLSRAMHAIAAARLGDPSLALRYFHDSTAVDLSDATGAAAGVHIAALGGLWQVAVFGFAGLAFDADTLQFDPILPATWQRLKFAVEWRGRKISVSIDNAGGRFEAELRDGAAMSLMLRGASHELRPGMPLKLGLTAWQIIS